MQARYRLLLAGIMMSCVSACALPPEDPNDRPFPLPPETYMYPSEAPTVWKVEELSWLAGTWVSTSEEGRHEEHWMTPQAGNITGVFRWINAEGKVQFLELIALDSEAEGVKMRIKHCNPGPGLKSWEPQSVATSLRLVQVKPNEAIFFAEFRGEDGSPLWLSYRRKDDALTIAFESGIKDSKPGLELHFKRQ